MITLYQFRPVWGLPNFSPFCMKVETYLRMSERPYQIRTLDLPKGPKGKLPFVRHGERVVADSSFIIDYLVQTFGDLVDAHLNAEQRAKGLAIQRLLEENLYWCALYSRWIDPDHWPQVRAVLFAHTPAVLRSIIARFAQQAVRKELWGQGMGRHTQAEVYAIGCKDVHALAVLLGEREFFLGAQPSSLDATAFAFLANVLWVPLATPIQQAARQHPELEAYCERMRSRYFPEQSMRQGG